MNSTNAMKLESHLQLEHQSSSLRCDGNCFASLKGKLIKNSDGRFCNMIVTAINRLTQATVHGIKRCLISELQLRYYSCINVKNSPV
jgi:hypothetical protein